MQLASAAGVDEHASRQLLRIQRRAAGDEQIDLDLRLVMDEVGAAPCLHGAAKRVGVDVEAIGQRVGQTIDV